VNDVRHKTLLGTLFHAPTIGSIDAIQNALIGIDGAGRIASVLRADDPRYTVALGEAEAERRLLKLRTGCFLLPGFVDLHVHAPHPQLGKALHVPLEVWLQHTFPLRRVTPISRSRSAPIRRSSTISRARQRPACSSPQSTRRRRDFSSRSA
jgi:cytosine/adenosine deaminase-related metal-dependent hydrolase